MAESVGVNDNVGRFDVKVDPVTVVELLDSKTQAGHDLGNDSSGQTASSQVGVLEKRSKCPRKIRCDETESLRFGQDGLDRNDTRHWAQGQVDGQLVPPKLVTWSTTTSRRQRSVFEKQLDDFWGRIIRWEKTKDLPGRTSTETGLVVDPVALERTRVP